MYIAVNHNGEYVGRFDYARGDEIDITDYNISGLLTLAKKIYPPKGDIIKEIWVPGLATINFVFKRKTFWSKFKSFWSR